MRVNSSARKPLLTPNTNLPSPPDPSDRSRMSMRFTIACSVTGARSRSSLPSGVRGQFWRTTGSIAGRASTVNSLTTWLVKKDRKTCSAMSGAASGVGASSRIRCPNDQTPAVPELPGPPASTIPPSPRIGGPPEKMPFPRVRIGSSTTLRSVIMSSRLARTKQPVGSATS